MSQSSLHRRVKRINRKVKRTYRKVNRTNRKEHNRKVKRTNRKVKRTSRKVKRKIQHRTNRKQNNRKQNRTNRKLNQRVNRRIKKKSYKKISGGLKFPSFKWFKRRGRERVVPDNLQNDVENNQNTDETDETNSLLSQDLDPDAELNARTPPDKKKLKQVKSEFKVKLKKAKKVLGIGKFTELNLEALEKVKQSHDTKLEDNLSHIRRIAEKRYALEYDDIIKARTQGLLTKGWYVDELRDDLEWAFRQRPSWYYKNATHTQVYISSDRRQKRKHKENLEKDLEVLIENLPKVDAKIIQANEFLMYVLNKNLLSGGTQSNLEALKKANELFYVEEREYEGGLFINDNCQ